MGDLQNNYIQFSDTENTDFFEYDDAALSNLVISFIQPPGDILVFENINFSFIDSDYCELDANEKNEMIHGIVDQIKFTYSVSNQFFNQGNYKINPSAGINLYAPVILNDVSYAYCSDDNVSTLEFTALAEVINIENDSCNDYELFLRKIDQDGNLNEELLSSDFSVDCSLFDYSDDCRLSQCTMSVNQDQDFYDLILDEIFQCYSSESCEAILKPNRIPCLNVDSTYLNDYSSLVVNDLPTENILENNLFNSLEQTINIPEEYFDSACYSVIYRNADQVINQGSFDNALLLSDMVEDLESGLYWVVIDECNSSCLNRSNTMPVSFNFIYDDIAPKLETINNFSGLGRDGFGHQYYYLEDFNYAYTDNIIIDDETVYINNQQYQIPINMTDSISVVKKLVIKEINQEDIIYNDSDVLLPQLMDDFIFDAITFQDLIYSFPGMLTNQNTYADLIYTLTDQAGNESIDTLKLTVVFESEDLVSDMYNYPNPFKTVDSNSGTTIRYMLSEDTNDLRFVILDGSSRVIKDIEFNENYKTMGTHHYYFDGKDNMGNMLSSGVYYGFLEVNGVVKTASPGPISHAINGINNASVPEEHAIAWFTPQ